MNKNTSKAAGLVCVAAIVCGCLVNFSDHKNTENSQSDTQTTTNKTQPKTIKQLLSQETTEAVLSETQSDADDVTSEMRAVSQKQKRVYELNTLAMRTQAQRVELEMLYADKALIQEHVAALVEFDAAANSVEPDLSRKGAYQYTRVSGVLPSEAESRRMDSIMYFHKALRLKNNASRTQVLAAIKSVLTNDNILPTYEEHVRRALIGDKVELYSILAASEPEEAESLSQLNLSPNVKSVLEVAKKYFNNGYRFVGYGEG